MPQELLQYLNDYLNSLECALQHWQPRNNLSMLEVVERMQLFDWNLGARRYQNFVWECQATTSTGKPEDFVATWSAWCSAVNFIKNVLTGYNEPNFKFLLKEYERKFGNNLHSKLDASITTKGLELEHIFAQRVDTDVQFNALGGFMAFGFTDRDDFDRNMLWRSGNLTWLSESANASLNNTIPNIKAAHYGQCTGHGPNRGENICPKIEIVKKLGNQMSVLGTSHRAYRFQLEARCAELAIFALQRFGG